MNPFTPSRLPRPAFARLSARELFLAAFLIAAIPVISLCAIASAAEKHHAYRGFKFRAVYSFVPSATARSLTIIRDIPRSSDHQIIRGETISAPAAGTLETREIGLNTAIFYKLDRRELEDHAAKNDLDPAATLEITYSCDFLGIAREELDGDFPCSLFPVKDYSVKVVRDKLISILGRLDLPDHSKCAGGTDEIMADLRTVFEFVESRVTYTRAKQKRAPFATLNLMSGNCISKTNLWRAFLSVMGIGSCDLSGVILSKKNRGVTHRFCVASVLGRNVPFCPTNKRFGVLPAHYMVLAIAKKDNLSRGTQRVSTKFEITPTVSGYDLDDLSAEFLGDPDSQSGTPE